MASTVTELLRRRFGGKSLPYDAEIEYLQSTDGAIINTGIYDVDAIEIQYMVGGWYSYYGLMGNYVDENHNVWRILQSSSSTSINVGVYVGAKATTGWNSVLGGSKNVVHTIYMSKTSIVCDGTQFSGTIATGQGTANTTPIAIFARNVSNPAYYNVQMKCYYFKAWKNGNLVIDIVPVRVGQVGYMYDKVSGQLFGNAGTGDFILGNDK